MRINPIVGIIMLIAAFLIDVSQVLAFFMMVIPNFNILGFLTKALLVITGPTNIPAALAGESDFSGGPAMAVGIGWYIGVVGLIGLLVWLALLKVNFSGKNPFIRIFAVVSAAVLEFIPIFNALPALTVGTAVVIFETMKDDLGIEIGLVDAALFLVPGGQGLALARATGTAAKAAKAAEAAKEVGVAQKTAKAAKAARKVRQADVGPGTQHQQKQVDINAPYRKVQAKGVERFADPYVPVSDEESEEEGRWVA